MLFKRKSSTDRLEDVADQDGFQRSFVAILIAVVLGLLFRAAFSQEAISGQVRRAAEKVHEKIWIEFDAADLSLADGPFPEFAIVVQKVRLASDEACWLSPMAEVDELRLPLDVWALLRGRIVISEIHLGQVQLQLRTDTSRCVEKRTSQSPPPAKAPIPAAPVTPAAGAAGVAPPSTATPLWTAPESRGPIARVFVHSLQVQYLPIPFTSFEINRLDVRRQSESPLRLMVGGELNLGGATLSGDYSSRARFDIDYGHPQVQVKLAGTWREGSYTLGAAGDIEAQTLALSGSIDHLPLSQILPVLKKYDLLKGEYDGRQIWLNMKFKSPAPQKWDAGVPVNFEALSFEGDLGRIEARPFQLVKWAPLELSNTEILFRGLQVEKLLRLFGQTEKPKSLGSLGELNGIMRLQDLRKFQLSGEYSGLEFIFANRGERKAQAISLMTGVLDYDHGEWHLNIDKLRPSEGLFLGDIQVSGSEAGASIRLKIHVDEMHLRPEVQSLMSGGGSLGRWAGDLTAAFIQGKVAEVTGQLVAQELLVDGVSINKLRATVASGKSAGLAKNIHFDLRAREVHIEQVSPARKLIDPLVAGLSAQAKPDWTFDQIQIKSDLSQENEEWSRFKWQLLPMVYEQIQFKSEGGWNPRGELEGVVDAASRSRSVRWRVEGLRDAPVFSQVSGR